MADIGPPDITNLSIPQGASTPSKAISRAPGESLPSPPRTPMPKPPSDLPSFLHRYASTTDQSLLRLQRLLTTTAGLETFLSTVNYALYILTFFEARSPSRLAFLERLNKLAGLHPSLSNKGPVSHPASSQTGPGSRSPFKTLGTLISETRTVLRLTALLPLYAWLRQLLVDNDNQDSYLRIISLTQCLSYIIFQFLENVAFLSDRGVVPQKWLATRGGSVKWWLWSSRAWCAGVSCDFLILFRKALIEQQRRSKAKLAKTEVQKEEEREEESEQSFDRRWWSEMFVASCWLPLSLHYSLRYGLRGMNPGAVGLLGFMAGMQSFAAQWARTESC